VCRHDAGRHCTAKTERISDSQDPIADLSLFGRKLDEFELLVGFDLDQRQIGTGIASDQVGFELRTIIHRHHDRAGIINHVMICDSKSIG